MILYFSGTGNSRHIAKIISDKTNDEILSMNELIKHKDYGSISSEAPFVVVTPTYAWRVPRIVKDFLMKVGLEGSREIYFVLTCGSDTGNAYGYAEKLASDINMQFKGLYEVVMPENYIAMFKVPDKATAAVIIAKGEKEAVKASEIIKSRGIFEKVHSGIGAALKSGIVNDMFYETCVTAKGFYTTDRCIGCGRCVKLCPLNNVKLADGKVEWGRNCTHCMACICGCPEKAVEYKNNSQKQERYWLE